MQPLVACGEGIEFYHMERAGPDIWQNLAVLLAVGEARSSLGAARALGISHEAVIRRVDLLEKWAGSVLVDRTTPQWSLTQSGLELAEQARSLADLVERSGDVAVKAAAPPVVLSCPELFFEHLLLPIWYRIHKKLPARPIQVCTTSPVTDQTVGSNELKLCLVRRLEPGLEGQEVGQVQLRMYAHRRLFSNLSGVPPCHFCVDNPLLKVPDLVWPKLGPPRPVVCANLAMVVAAVKSGQGIGLMPEFIGQKDQNLLPLGGVDLPPFSLWILHRSTDAADQEYVASLRALLVREIAPILSERTALSG